MKKVVIIGAGPAGLTAAYQLLKKRKDYQVIILEKEKQVGGISKTVHYKGNRIKFIISANSYIGELKIGEPDKCEKLEWFSLNKLPSNLQKRTRKVLAEIQKEIFYDNSDFINLDE